MFGLSSINGMAAYGAKILDEWDRMDTKFLDGVLCHIEGAVGIDVCAREHWMRFEYCIPGIEQVVLNIHTINSNTIILYFNTAVFISQWRRVVC